VLSINAGTGLTAVGQSPVSPSLDADVFTL